MFIGDSIEEGARHLAEMQPDDSCVFYAEFLIESFSVEKRQKVSHITDMENSEDIKLYEGDCFGVLGQISEGSIDLLLTDPPYLIDVHSGGRMYASGSIQSAINELETSNINESYDINAFADLVVPKFRNGVNAYFWCNKLQICDYFKCWIDRYKCRFEILKWFKQNAIPNYSNKYMTDTEYCLYFYNGAGHCHPESYIDASTMYVDSINQEDKRKYGHPTIKPLPFTERMIRNSSREGDVVLDAFMGSGTTGLACRLNNRKFIGIEKNKTYFDVASNRIWCIGEQDFLF